MDPRDTEWRKFDADSTASLEDLSKSIAAAKAEAEQRREDAANAAREAELALMRIEGEWFDQEDRTRLNIIDINAGRGEITKFEREAAEENMRYDREKWEKEKRAIREQHKREIDATKAALRAAEQFLADRNADVRQKQIDEAGWYWF